jgi:hypothetical protein
MQTLVNEFRDYARLPAAQMKPLDLNALVAEVLALYGHALDNGLLRAPLEAACRASWATPRSCGRSSTTWCRTRWTRWPTAPTARSR